jgi:hypothetical protein
MRAAIQREVTIHKNAYNTNGESTQAGVCSAGDASVTDGERVLVRVRARTGNGLIVIDCSGRSDDIHPLHAYPFYLGSDHGTAYNTVQ